MSRINRVKSSRKEFICSKCGNTIPIGSSYVYGKVYRRRTPVRRCVSCGLKPYELSTSTYVHSVAPIVEEWESIYGVADGVWIAIADDLQNIFDEVQESFENIPYQLQEGDVASLLQERAYQLESAIVELDFDMENFLSEALQGLETEEQETIYALQGGRTLKEVYEDLADKEEDTSGNSVFAHWKEETESEIVDSIEEVLGELSY